MDYALVAVLGVVVVVVTAAFSRRLGIADGILDSPHQQYRDLRREVLQTERAVLLEARSRGTYPSRILTRAQALLD